MSNIFITLKKDLFGCFKIMENKTMTMKTGLKERGVIEIENYSAPFAMLAPSLEYLPRSSPSAVVLAVIEVLLTRRPLSLE